MIYLNQAYNRLPQKAKRVRDKKTGRFKTPKEYIYFIQIGKEDRVFKIGTTNDMERRMKEHEKYYNKDIIVIWFIAVTSKWTTLQVEENNKQDWIDQGIFNYLRNDRFIIPPSINNIDIKIRKKYPIDFDCVCAPIN